MRLFTSEMSSKVCANRSIAALSFFSGLIVLVGGSLAFCIPIALFVVVDLFWPLSFQLDDVSFSLDEMALCVFSLWVMGVMLKRRCGLSLVAIGLGSLSISRAIRACLIAFMIATVYAIPSALLWPDDVVPFWVDGEFSLSISRCIQDLMLAVLIGPLYEEVFCRGVLYQTLRTKLSWVLSVLLCTAIFTLLHDPPAQVTGALLLGLVTCYVMEKRGSITECFAIHAAYNFFVLAERIGYEYVTMVAHMIGKGFTLIQAYKSLYGNHLKR